MGIPPFHLSICVADLAATRAFYEGLLSCHRGRTSPHAIDFSFFGHQLTCHLDPAGVRKAEPTTLNGNHFGVILAPDEFHRLAALLREANVPFLTPAHVEREGTPGERWGMVVADPSGNAVELKAYRDEAEIFRPAGP
jgi:extradiol dioxygenase family protein